MTDPTEHPAASPSLWKDAVRLMFRTSQFMVDPTEDEIRTRAFLLWRDAGEPDGMKETFWYQAEEELRSAGSNR